MREITCGAVSKLVARLCVQANRDLPEDVCQAIEGAARRERSPVGKSILEDLAENFRYAGQSGLPICQDTGMAVVFIRLGQEVRITGGLLTDAVNEGVRRGYVDGLLRCSVVSDPLRRENTGDNTPAVIHLELIQGDEFTVTVAPKGFGSENMSVMRMFNPSVGAKDIEDFMVESVDRAGARPCPPVILGVGLGGTAEKAALCAKKALLRPVGSENPDPLYAEMEKDALDRVNRLGIGPQGMGGTVTALAVHIEPTATHIAGLPCVINFSCHATRHAEGSL